MKKATELSRRVAESDVAAILLQGETGTGKDLFATRSITLLSVPISPISRSTVRHFPQLCIESELFGYEKGAFTDAKQRKEGLFEQAAGRYDLSG